jgi:hypothetical protein
VVKGNPRDVLLSISEYTEGSSILFEKVLAISMHARIPNLTHVYGFDAIHDVLSALLTQFSNSLNLIRPMSADQIYETAFAMVMTTQEDLLSIEDYVLFFKGAREGKYGKILDRLDQQTVFALLEEYRQERHRQFLRIKENKHLELKGLGPSERTTALDPLEESFYNIAGRLGEIKEKLKEQREINRMNKFQKDL